MTAEPGPPSRHSAGPIESTVQGAFREALLRLGLVQKSGRGAPPYSRWVNRRVGRWLAAGAYVRGLTPNQVTAISACCTFAGIALIALVEPRWWLGLATCALLLLGYALDSADGQLARLRGGGSKSGEWLDHVVDATKVCVLHSAVLVSFYRFTIEPAPIILLAPLAYQAVSSVFFFSFILIEQLRKETRNGVDTRTGRRTGSSLIQSTIAFPTDYATLCLSFILFGWRSAFIAVYVALLALNALILVGALLRWWRELRALDRGAVA